MEGLSNRIDFARSDTILRVVYLLAKVFSKVADGPVKKLIPEQFRIDTATDITCKKCKVFSLPSALLPCAHIYTSLTISFTIQNVSTRDDAAYLLSIPIQAPFGSAGADAKSLEVSSGHPSSAHVSSHSF